MLFVGFGAGTALGAVAVSVVLLLKAPVLVPMPIVIPAPPVVIPEPTPTPLPEPPSIPPEVPGYGRFACATKPLGAEVWIDGQNTGEKTPISMSKAIPLKVGRHLVVFRRDGKRSGPHEIEVREGEIAKLTGIIVE